MLALLTQTSKMSTRDTTDKKGNRFENKTILTILNESRKMNR